MTSSPEEDDETELLSFAEHQQRRDENPSTVRCVRCREWIPATSTRCPECRIHFQGQAQDYFDDDEKSYFAASKPIWSVIVAVILLALSILGLFVW